MFGTQMRKFHKRITGQGKLCAFRAKRLRTTCPIFFLIFLGALLICGCDAGQRRKLDRNSPEYQEVVYRLWRQHKLSQFEKWYAEKYEN